MATSSDKITLTLRCRVEREHGYAHVRFYAELREADGHVPYDKTFKGYWLQDFMVYNQLDADNSKREGTKDYAWTVCFKPYCVELRECEAMAKTLKMIERKTQAMREQFGTVATYGQFVSRVAIAIGATAIVFDSRRFAQESMELSVGDSVSKIDGIVNDLARELRGEPVEQAA